MHQPIDQGGREGVVDIEDGAPVLESAVGRDDDRAGFIAGSNHLEQQIRTALVHGQISQRIDLLIYVELNNGYST
jgi:hypothetical protein